MKWLVYALILINLAFALWHYRFREAAEPVSKLDDDTLNLVLLKEYLAKQEVSPEEPSKSATETVTTRCYTLGPFKTKQAAAEIGEQMLAAGIQVKRRLNKDNSRKGYWVIIPAEKTRKAARKHVEKLKSQGIKDYFLVVTGEHVNAVSLGVFSMSESAQRRFNEMKKLGFTPNIEQVDLPLREYWLDWPLVQKLPAAKLANFRSEHKNIGQTERNCNIE